MIYQSYGYIQYFLTLSSSQMDAQNPLVSPFNPLGTPLASFFNMYGNPITFNKKTLASIHRKAWEIYNQEIKGMVLIAHPLVIPNL